MLVIQKAMEKSKLYQIDDFGVKNYNYGVITLASLLLFVAINIGLGYATYWAEIATDDSPITNFPDALWLMLMSSTTIGFGDVYPVTLIGRTAVFIMFILGVGILGGIGAVFVNKLFGFADTNIKNRELRQQNAEIIKQNDQVLKKLAALEQQLEKFKSE